MKITKKAPIKKRLILDDLAVGAVFCLEGEVYYYIKMENSPDANGCVKTFGLYSSEVKSFSIDADVELYDAELILRRSHNHD